MTRISSYETVGDVRRDVDAVFAPRNMRSAGGVFYPHTQAVIFGLVNSSDERVGDAYCPLPNGGWVSESYWPANQRANDALWFRVVKGAGKLILPLVGIHSIGKNHNPGVSVPLAHGGHRSFQLINTGDELLIVHARSVADPSSHTDINRPGIREIDDSWTLASETVYTHAETFKPDGGVDFELTQ